ncbi:MAG: bifunctional metallophosphatase/5'-nucleotidase [Ignavibacteriae bacterium]|nr:MAG: bifunctional metallophosphatase/5'-nucleotidase [Ignavibacteriota bacterium]
MFKRAALLYKLTFLFLFTCSIQYAKVVDIVFLHMNDVYEITPLEGGKYGGLSRVAELRKQLLKQNPNTYTVLPGDFISPSALGTAEFEGKRINGAQMIDVLNTLGLDFAMFGNHEFDYKYEVLQDRMDESKFEWISSNVYHDQNGLRQSFRRIDHPIPQYVILKIPSSGKKMVRVGMIALCIDVNKQPYVYYENSVDAGKRIYSEIKDSIDFLIAMTHLTIQQDKELAAAMPEIKFIMGGHEHFNMYVTQDETIIAKADANAKSVYVHHLLYDTKRKKLKIESELKTIDTAIKNDGATSETVNKWVDRAFSGFRSKGFEPNEIVTTLNEPLDGLEINNRFYETNLGKVIGEAMYSVSRNSTAAIFNSGSVRIDDNLMGEISQYDIIRTLPFGGKIIEIEVTGELLLKILNTGIANRGSRGFLQYYGIQYDSSSVSWGFNGHGIIETDTYNIAVSDYLLTGMEQNMSFLKRDNPGILKILEPQADDKSDLRNDIRLALIKYLKEKK